MISLVRCQTLSAHHCLFWSLALLGDLCDTTAALSFHFHPQTFIVCHQETFAYLLVSLFLSLVLEVFLEGQSSAIGWQPHFPSLQRALAF